MPLSPSENLPECGPPIPTKFFRSDAEIIAEAAKSVGLNRSEVIRRAVRLLGRQKKLAGSYHFLADLTRDSLTRAA